jgi:hypothetical protein
MKSASLLFLFLIFSGVFAQSVENFIEPVFSTVLETAGKIGLLPRFNVCEGEERCQLLSYPEVKAFFIVLVMVWMIFNVIFRTRAFNSAIFSLVITSLMFNHLPSLFSVSVMGLFTFVFSGLFVFMWMNYLMKFLWGFSPTTKLLLSISVTMIGMMFIGVKSIFDLLSNWLTYVVSWVGIVIFFVFMFLMRLMSAYAGFVSGYDKLKKGGAVEYGAAKKASEKKNEAIREVIGGEEEGGH